MRVRGSSASVALFAVFALIGCGGDDAESASSGESTAKGPPLITIQDLPPGARERPTQGSTAPCSPIPMLQGGKKAMSPLFSTGGSEVQQVIGVFSTTKQARAALTALKSKSRRDCIRTALQLFGFQESGQVVKVSISPPRRLSFGDEAVLMSFAVKPPQSKESQMAVAVMRVDRALSETLFLTKEADRSTNLIAQVTQRANGRLDAFLE